MSQFLRRGDQLHPANDLASVLGRLARVTACQRERLPAMQLIDVDSAA
ncbi:hypothetical protein [Novipirellula rosea]